MFQVFLQDIYLEAANRLSSLNLKQDLAVGVLLVIYIFTWYQCLINKCSKCYEPRAFAPPPWSFVQICFLLHAILEFRCRRQTIRKGAHVLHTLYRNFIRRLQIKFFILSGNYFLRESAFDIANCLKSFEFYIVPRLHIKFVEGPLLALLRIMFGLF